MSRIGDPTQPIAAVLDNARLPKALHKMADAWRTADDTATDTELALNQAEADALEAPDKDDAAMRTAIEAGTKPPVPHDQYARQAASDLAAARVRYRLAHAAKKTAGDALLAGLLEHRTAIAEGAGHAVTTAAVTYREALARAQSEVNNAATALAESTELLGLLDELDGDPRYRYELGAPSLAIVDPDFGPAMTALRLIEARASDITAPADRLTVRASDGRLIEVPRSTALRMVAELDAELVNAEDIDGDVMQVDQPNRIPVGADRY